jgi:DNA 3'-phosphatase
MEWKRNVDKESLTSSKDYYGGALWTRRSPIDTNKPLILVDFDGTVFEMKKRGFAGSPAVSINSVINAISKFARSSDADVYVVTNQKWTMKTVSAQQITARLESGISILVSAGVPIKGLFAALGEDEYRKPNVGLLELILAGANKPAKIMMIGDAAGREGDHSCCDRQFAYNIGAHFETPESFVAMVSGVPAQPQAFNWGPISPEFIASHLIRNGGAPTCGPLTLPPGAPAGTCEIVVLCGFPGSGKTSLAKALEKFGYARLSADEYPKANILNALLAVPAGMNIVVDRVHGTISSREPYIAFARQRGLICRAIVMGGNDPISKAWSQHKMLCRTLCKGSSYTIGSFIPSIAYSKFGKEMPTTAEGFHFVEINRGDVDLDVCGDMFAEKVKLLLD